MMIALVFIFGFDALILLLNITLNIRQTCVFKQQLERRIQANVNHTDALFTFEFAPVTFLLTIGFVFIPDLPTDFVIGYRVPKLPILNFLVKFCDLYTFINLLIILWVEMVKYM